MTPLVCEGAARTDANHSGCGQGTSVLINPVGPQQAAIENPGDTVRNPSPKLTVEAR